MLVLLAIGACSEAGLWARLIPVTRPNPYGSQVEPLRSGAALAKYRETLAYLRQVPLAREILRRVEHSRATYQVEVNDANGSGIVSGANEFDGVQNRVHWDPDLALKWRGAFFSSHRHSAAIGLMHELGHAYHKDLNARDYWRLSQTKTDQRWSNLEERRTVLEIENPVAEALGESPRFFHRDNGYFLPEFYAAGAPTSTRPAGAQPQRALNPGQG